MSSAPVVYATPPPPQQPALNEFERVVDTYIAPSRTFNDIFRSTAWWMPLILLLVAGLGLAYTIDHKVGFDRVYTSSLHASPTQEDRVNQLPPEQKATMLARGAAGTRYATYAFGVFILIFFAIYSLILWGSFNFGLGAQTRYPQVFAVVFYAALPYLLRTIVTILTLSFGRDVDSFDLKNPVESNPAFYMPDAAPWLRALLARVDIFEFWVLALTVLGMAIIARRTVAQSATLVVGLYVVTTLLYVGFAAFS